MRQIFIYLERLRKILKILHLFAKIFQKALNTHKRRLQIVKNDIFNNKKIYDPSGHQQINDATESRLEVIGA